MFFYVKSIFLEKNEIVILIIWLSRIRGLKIINFKPILYPKRSIYRSLHFFVVAFFTKNKHFIKKKLRDFIIINTFKKAHIRSIVTFVCCDTKAPNSLTIIVENKKFIELKIFTQWMCSKKYFFHSIGIFHVFA